MDALDYWKLAKSRMPILSKIAIHYLLPLVSSALSERIFSLEKCVESRQKNAML